MGRMTTYEGSKKTKYSTSDPVYDYPGKMVGYLIKETDYKKTAGPKKFGKKSKRLELKNKGGKIKKKK